MGRLGALVAATFAMFAITGRAQARIVTPANSFDWTAESNKGGASFGVSVSSAGDVNADGYQDVVVGAYGFNSFQGRAYVYLGSSTGLHSTPSWIATDPTAGLFGNATASAGDVNADGYDDVLVGAPNSSHGEVGEGRAFLYLGSPTGPSLVADWVAEPDQAFAGFGVSVASAGDVNGDGHADVLVGADELGRAYLYLGSPAGLGSTPAWTADGQASAFFGHSVASAGDVNGDGYDDALVGSQYYQNGQQAEGRAYLYLGSPAGLGGSPSWTAESDQAAAYFGTSVASAGDANGDGYDDVLVGALGYDGHQVDSGRAFLYLGSAAGLGSAPGWTAEPNRTGTSFGDSVASAGDVNGDGYDDTLVGADLFTNRQLDEGASFVFMGSATGLTSTPASSFESDQVNARAGRSVASAGDVNADGYSDVLIGIYYFDHPEADEGAAVAFYGGAS